MNVDRIRTEYDVNAMVALDSFDLIVARVRNLLEPGRRMSMTHRYTYLDRAPDLYTGLTVDTDAHRGGIEVGDSGDGKYFSVFLAPGLRGFGFSAYAHDGNTTEAEAWRRYHAKKATSDSFSERRRDMTRVDITGGREGDGPGRSDLLVIRDWNRDGVCQEMVIGFDNATVVTR